MIALLLIVALANGTTATLRQDLDGDGHAETITATLLTSSNGIGIQNWTLTIVDGRTGRSSVTEVQDFSRDLIRGATVMVTSWEWIGGHLYFVARPHVYVNAALHPDKKRGMWRRRYLLSFQRERNSPGSTSAQWLERAAHVAWR